MARAKKQERLVVRSLVVKPVFGASDLYDLRMAVRFALNVVEASGEAYAAKVYKYGTASDQKRIVKDYMALLSKLDQALQELSTLSSKD